MRSRHCLDFPDLNRLNLWVFLIDWSLAVYENIIIIILQALPLPVSSQKDIESQSKCCGEAKLLPAGFEKYLCAHVSVCSGAAQIRARHASLVNNTIIISWTTPVDPQYVNTGLIHTMGWTFYIHWCSDREHDKSWLPLEVGESIWQFSIKL